MCSIATEVYQMAREVGEAEAVLEMRLRHLMVYRQQYEKEIREAVKLLQQRADAYSAHAFDRALENALSAPLPMPPRPGRALPPVEEDPEEARLQEIGEAIPKIAPSSR